METASKWLNTDMVIPAARWIKGKGGIGIQGHIGTDNGEARRLALVWLDPRGYFGPSPHETLINYTIKVKKQLPLDLSPMISCDPRPVSDKSKGNVKNQCAHYCKQIT